MNNNSIQNHDYTMIVKLKVLKQFMKQNAKIQLYKNQEKFYGLLKQNLYDDIEHFCQNINDITNNYFIVQDGYLFQNSNSKNNNSFWNTNLLYSLDFSDEIQNAFEKSLVEISS